MAPQERERTKTPGIYKRGSRYQVIYRDRLGRQRSAMAASMSEARSIKAQKQTDAKRGITPDTTLTLGAYCTQWLDLYQGRTRKGVAESTMLTYERQLRLHVLPTLGRVRLSALGPQDIKALVVDLRDVVTTGYARDILATLKAVLKTAVADGLLSSNPAESLVVSEGSRTRRINPNLTLVETVDRKALSLVEMQSILKRAGDDRLMFQFLYETGVRVAELTAVQWMSVDLAARTVVIDRQLRRGKWTQPKGLKTRTVPLSTSVVEQLVSRQGAPTERLFPISDETVRVRLAAITEGLGLGWVTPHTFRHTCATHLFQSGANVKQVQLWLGHADPAFTLRTYIHQLPDALPDADLFTG